VFPDPRFWRRTIARVSALFSAQRAVEARRVMALAGARLQAPQTRPIFGCCTEVYTDANQPITASSGPRSDSTPNPAWHRGAQRDHNPAITDTSLELCSATVKASALRADRACESERGFGP
jgi:hypothetical protein